MDGAWLYAAVLTVLAAVFVNGATDAPVMMGASLLSGTLTRREAARISAIGNGAGLLLSLWLFPAVGETVRALAAFGAGKEARGALLAVLLSAIVWAVAAWRVGIPTSESHALLAALAGASTALGGGADILGGAVAVGAGLALSLGGGAMLGRWLLGLSARILCPKTRIWRRAPAVMAAAMSFLHGAQDGQKFAGIYLLVLSAADLPPSPIALVPVLVALTAGSACVGGRILDALGKEGETDERTALAAEGAAAACLAACTAMGLPVSTTHLKTAALAGAGGTRITRATAAAWLLTAPACFALAYAITKFLCR